MRHSARLSIVCLADKCSERDFPQSFSPLPVRRLSSPAAHSSLPRLDTAAAAAMFSLPCFLTHHPLDVPPPICQSFRPEILSSPQRLQLQSGRAAPAAVAAKVHFFNSHFFTRTVVVPSTLFCLEKLITNNRHFAATSRKCTTILNGVTVHKINKLPPVPLCASIAAAWMLRQPLPRHPPCLAAVSAIRRP